MATQAHLRANKRYLEQFVTKSIRVRKDQWKAVEAHLQARGYVSFAGWVQSLMEQDMGLELNVEPEKSIQADDGQIDLFSNGS